MDTLTKLFGSSAKVKAVKLFVFNPGVPYDAVQIATRTKESLSKIRREVTLMEKMGLIHRKVFYKTIARKVRSRMTHRKIKANGWILDSEFEHLVPLQAFLVSLNHLDPKTVARKLTRTGTVKLVIVSGIFIQNSESRVDLLVVGDNIKKGLLETAVKTIEAEIGKEIRYAFFETAVFKYRLGLYDKLIRDILDFPHEKVVNKLGIM